MDSPGLLGHRPGLEHTAVAAGSLVTAQKEADQKLFCRLSLPCPDQKGLHQSVRQAERHSVLLRGMKTQVALQSRPAQIVG